MDTNVKTRYITQGLHTEYFSVAWMAFEFLVGLCAGIKAGSILLVAFGLDSFLEIIAGITLVWRLRQEQAGASKERIEQAERRSGRIVGGILLLLAVYVTLTAGYNLLTHQAPESSFSGMAIAIASVLLMPILTIRKRSLGKKINSLALIEDGMCNITCAYMAATVLIGAMVTALLGWWWADSIGALVLVYFIASEGWEAFHGED
ncbi:cation transporter [Furfurilactobacillus curtus]|uniref:Membrane protein n=1 Tax=Furfurilactobacillus curtus TaxID=1746200 RepID=A0ABQ5JRX5_9LACO